MIDLILGSHSVPFASTLKQELERRDAVSSVDFLTLCDDRKLDEYFEAPESVHVIREDAADGVGYYTPIVDSFRKMITFIQQRSYSVVHVLQVDNVLVESAIALHSVEDLPPVVAQINGAFFGKEHRDWPSGVYRLASMLLSSPVSRLAQGGLVRNKSSGLADDISLCRCLEADAFDHLLVHTTAARAYVLNRCPGNTPVTVVPEPPTVDTPALDRATARHELGIDQHATVVLFFGGLRKEKGIHLLLDALQRYDGPEFTLLVAGPEKDITEDRLQEVSNTIGPSLSMDVRYIHDTAAYFVASDGVVCPYMTEFGAERTSHVFQEAITLRRPVICPSFGSFESRLKTYNLGVSYTADDAQALSDVLGQFVDNVDDCYSEEDMAAFSARHSFENLCTGLLDTYRSAL